MLCSLPKFANVPISVRKSMPLLDGRISKVTRFTKCLLSIRDSRPSQRISHFRRPKLAHEYTIFLKFIL